VTGTRSATAGEPLLARSLGMWFVLLAAMMGNGILRVGVLQPRFGEDLARQLACLSGAGIVLALSAPFVRRLRNPSSAQLLSIGALWLVLTLAFEFSFGRYVSGLSWRTLLADYDLSQGRLWPLLLLTTLLAPWLVGHARAGKRAPLP
jgi:hypothetical protein